MYLGVDVNRALDVEAWVDGLHLHHALRISGPHAAEEGGVIGVQIRDADFIGIGDVEFVQEVAEWDVGAAFGERGIASCSVAVPEVNSEEED